MRLRRYPVTVGAVLLLWILAVTTASVPGGTPSHLRQWVGAGVGPVTEGRWWVLLTASWWATGLIPYLVATGLLVLVLPTAERHVGSRRTAGLLVAVPVLGAATGLGLAVSMRVAGGRWAEHLRHAVVVDPSATMLGVALAVSAALPVLWRRRIRVVLLVILATFVLYSGQLADLIRLSTGLVGLSLGLLLFGRGEHRALSGPSRPETRVLLALVVAASALGPLLAAVVGTGSGPLGPLSVLRYLVADPLPDASTVHDICADAAAAHECLELHLRLRLSGVGPAIMAVMPVALLLVVAEGLRRGRRAAWLSAVLLHLGLAGLGLLLAASTLATPADQRMILGPGSHPHSRLLMVLPLLAPLLVAALLLITRGQFTVRAPAGTYRRWGVVVGLTGLVVSVVYAVGSLLIPSGYDGPVNLGTVLLDLPTRFLPPGYLGEIEPTFLPDQTITTWLYEWTGVVFWTVAAVAGLLAFTLSRPPQPRSDRGQLGTLLTGPGGTNLAHMVTWPGHSYFFTEDRRAVIAYRVVSGVAVTTGGPVGDPDRRADAVRGFAAHCHESGWTACLYSIDGETLAITRAMGWRQVQVAEETVLPLPELEFTGRAWQDVRSALNRAKKLGVTAEWCRFRHTPLAITDQIRTISQEWVADRGLPELGFTLGGLEELSDDEVRLLIAVDADRKVHAVTSWLPVYRDGVVVGWTLDFMRRRADGMVGATEFLVASAARLCQAEGARFLSLSGAPLARVDRGQPVASLQRLLDTAGRMMEPVYGFRSLMAFKAKFQPRYEPLYLAYADPAALPAIATAIARAYLPHLTPRQLSRLGMKLLT
jgi:phosphatidylglycerol lysyltransferase